ncbi:hypothetical protein [Modestobacter altitudinis]|uniref:hypothetical protein n=1 Tax=Modestobacter altitudinis TaxID=2213158 RepID=UPI00110CB2F9|nr:hypothetical protein [Modestobacter altitudinis]
MTVPVPSSDADRMTGRPAAVRVGTVGLPNRAALRGLRLEGSAGRLTLTRAGRELRSFTVGPGQDVEQAEHLGGPKLLELAPTSLGAVDLVGPGGARVARLDLREWVPEAEELSRPKEALDRSSVVEVLQQAGLPLRPVPPSELAAVLDTRVPSLLPFRRVPVAYTVLRSVAVVLATVTLLWAIVTDVPDLLWPLGSLALLLSTLVAVGMWAGALARDRISDGSQPVLRPHPSAPATRRFRRTARVRVEPDAVVVVDGMGRERRLPREGALAVTTASVVREGTDTAALELRTEDGTPRATLPWSLWCGGDGGADALERTCAAAGLALERRAAPARRSAAEEAAARKLFSSPARGWVQNLTWPHGLPGQAAVWQTAAMSALLLLYGVADQPPAWTRWVLGGTLLLALGQHLVRLVARRWLDREVSA